MNFSRNFYAVVAVIILVAGSFLLGTYVGYRDFIPGNQVVSVFNKDKGQPVTVDFEPFWEA